MMRSDTDGPDDRAHIDQDVLFEMQAEFSKMARRLHTHVTVDLAFLIFLRRMSRFGYFQYGPITIDVNMIQSIVEQTSPQMPFEPGRHDYADSYVRFSKYLIEEVQRSGRSRIDELHFLLAFMRCGEGLPQRVFSELGVTPEQVEAYARQPASAVPERPSLEKLYSPEEAAEYLGVHVQTVRAWIRSGRLPASRLTGQRALRIRASDLTSVLEPVDPADTD